MTSKDILVRKGTTNEYKVVFHSHWSDIVNVNDPTDTDTIKWCWDNDFVSARKGHMYTVKH
jgi:hypothetical protein